MVIYRTFRVDAITSFRRYRYVMQSFYQAAGALGYRIYVNGLLRMILGQVPCSESAVAEYCEVDFDEFNANTGLDGQLLQLTEDLYDELKEAVSTYVTHESDNILSVIQISMQSATPTGYLLDVEYIASCRTLPAATPHVYSGRNYR